MIVATTPPAIVWKMPDEGFSKDSLLLAQAYNKQSLESLLDSETVHSSLENIPIETLIDSYVPVPTKKQHVAKVRFILVGRGKPGSYNSSNDD